MIYLIEIAPFFLHVSVISSGAESNHI